MEPKSGQLVKVLFNNGTAVEGIVIEWSDDKSVLKSKNGESILIIQKTKQDVLSVIINLRYKEDTVSTKVEQIEVEQREVKQKVQPVIDEDLEKQYEKIKDESSKDLSSDDLRIRKLVELKSELNRLEKEEFFNQFRSHEMTRVGSVGNYVLPNFSKKPRPFKRPSAQNQGEDVRDHSSLPPLFNNKNKNSR